MAMIYASFVDTHGHLLAEISASALTQNPHLAKQGHTVPQASNHGLENTMQEAQNLDEAKNQTRGSSQTR
jgi:hypothetical protein